MIIRQKLPVDTSFCIDIDVEPWILWGEVPQDWVVKIMELSQPVGFVVYNFDRHMLILRKLCVRDDLIRTGIGTETLHWIINRCRLRGYVGVECALTEQQMFSEGMAMAYLLQSCGFESKVIRGKYVFRRPIVTG